jgi:hypothetical protein
MPILERPEVSVIEHYQGKNAMPTPTELRVQAKECLELANKTNEHYAKVALKELSHKLHRDARQAERRERDMASFSKLQARSQ